MALTDHLTAREAVLNAALGDMETTFEAKHETASPQQTTLIMFGHQSSKLQPLTHLKYLSVTTTDLSNHLSHTPETSCQGPFEQSRFVSGCAGDKRSFSVFTSGMCEVNDKYVR